jgi:acyl-homoserine lactone acylase PvdQ
VLAAFGLVLLLAAWMPAMAQSPVRPYRANDFGHTVLNVMPPGQKGVFAGAEAVQAQAACPATGGSCSINPADYPPYTIDQLLMYDNLVRVSPGLTEARLREFFKDADFGVPPNRILRQYSPGNRAGLVVLRDVDYNVPHVYGLTRADVIYGTGYVTAEDRLFFLDVLRHVGRGRMSEFLGPSPSNLASDRAQYRVAGYSEAELQAQLDNLPADDPTFGPLTQQAFRDFADGVNEYILEATLGLAPLPVEYAGLQQVPLPWSPTDTVAVASLIGGIFGVGGGGELSNCTLLKALDARYADPAVARQVFEDLQEDDDPEAPVTTHQPFPYLIPGPVDPAALACPDGSTMSAALSGVLMAERPRTLDGPRGPVTVLPTVNTSNALLVGKSRSASGFPLAVMGPQVSYYMPQVLMEMDIHAPGTDGPAIDARGAAFPGISLLILLGRGRDYSWSATSAGSDLVDTVAAPLCEPDPLTPVTLDSRHYVYQGQCRPMEQRTDVWVAKPSAGGIPSQPPMLPAPPGLPPDLPDLTSDPLFVLGPPDPITGNVVVTAKVLRTIHGIVQSFATVNGAPVAYVRQRSTFKHEVDGATPFIKLNSPDLVQDAASFQHAMAGLNFTFNWFYVDRDDIAWQLSGSYPQRAAGIDPDLPYFATGQWDWLDWDGVRNKAAYLPFASLPGEINPAQGYITNWNNKQAPLWNSADANLSYSPIYRSQLLEDRILANPSMTLPNLIDAMEDAATVDVRIKVLPVLLQLIGPGSTGSGDADLGVTLLSAWLANGAHRLDRDNNGQYDEQAPVALVDRWWSGLARAVFATLTNPVIDAVPLGFNSGANPGGSAYASGWYGYIQKDLRGVIAGGPVAPWSRLYCGDGNLAACRSAVIASLASAVQSLKTQYGNDPAAWDVNENAEKIEHSAAGLENVPLIQWQNRPTFQQAVEYRRDAQDADDDAIPNTADNCPFAANPAQTDTDGDGTGDACECGDANLNGRVQNTDADLVRDALLGLRTLPPGSLCDTNNDGACTNLDATRIRSFTAGALTKADLTCREKSGP